MKTRSGTETQRSERGRRAGSIVAGAILLVTVTPATADTFYVDPSHPAASDGDNYACQVRPSCQEENRIALGYGTQSMPFGSLREGEFQVQKFGPAGVDTIYVAPGIYREHVYMAGHDDLQIIADTTGVHTGSSPGEVIVTGSEPLDESAFVPVPGTPGVWVLPDARRPDGLSICLTTAHRPPGRPCEIAGVAEAGNPDPDKQRALYRAAADVADVGNGFGRFYADVDDSDPDLPVDLYVRTHDGGAPDPALELEYVLDENSGNSTYDIFYRHRHCFDLEGGAERNLIEGFTCRYTSSRGINIAMGSNTVRGNLVYGIDDVGINAWASPVVSTQDTRILGNEVSHSVLGISVSQRENDTYVENNVLHSNIGQGLSVTISALSSAGTAATVFVGNNTLDGNFINLRATGVGTLIAVDNSFSHSTAANYSVLTGGAGQMDHNNTFGGTQAGTSSIPVSNLSNLAPGYRDPAAFDFHLVASSPLRDAGTSAAVLGYLPPTDDRDGTPRSAPNDVGAYEYTPCGDGTVDDLLGEQCDDGNRDDGDGCDASCQIEPGYVFDGVLYATDAHCDCLYTVDGAGIKTLVAPLPAQALSPTNMAVHPLGSLFVVDNSTGRLYTVDPATGIAVKACSGLPNLHGLAINPVDVPGPAGSWPAGTLFASRTSLYVIDPSDCGLTDLGPIGAAGEVFSGLDFRPDGTLFGAQLAAFGQPESLFAIDTATAQGSLVGTIGPGFDRVGSLAFDANGVLWVSDINTSNPRLVRLDPQTGTILHEIALQFLGAGQPFSPQGLGLVSQ